MKNPREIGRVLKEARQEKGLSLEKVWGATRIQGRIIEALEEGRAEEILARVYVLLFLKKYASFLDLDAEELVRSYKAFYTTPETEILDISKKPPTVKPDMRKWMLPMFGIFFLFIATFFIVRMSTEFDFYRRQKKRPVLVLESTKEGLSERAKAIFPIPQNKKINLTLQSDNDVWMRIRQEGRVIFEGTLKKDKTKIISSEKDIRLWVGRAEALDFTINGVSLGKIGKGNIRNIQILKDGLKVGKRWLIKTKE